MAVAHSLIPSSYMKKISLASQTIDYIARNRDWKRYT